MSVTDRKANKDAKFVQKILDASIVTLTASATEPQLKFTPGYAFEVLEIHSYCKTNTNVTVQVTVGGRSALAGGTAVAPVAATDTKHALNATRANVIGSATESIEVDAISGATPALPTGVVTIIYRAHPTGADAS